MPKYDSSSSILARNTEKYREIPLESGKDWKVANPIQNPSVRNQ